MKNVLTLSVALVVAAFASQAAVAQSVIDPASFSAQVEMALDDFHADDQPDLAFTVDALEVDAQELATENAWQRVDYAFADSSDGQATLSLTANGSGGEQTSASNSVSVNFETAATMRYRFTPFIIELPQQAFSASLNDLTVNGHYDPLAADLLGGNYFNDADAWPAEGVLPAGEHELTFTFSGAGYRGISWFNEAGATLELTPVPEPASAALLMLASLTLLRRRPTT